MAFWSVYPGERIPSVFCWYSGSCGRRFRFPCGRSMSITGCAARRRIGTRHFHGCCVNGWKFLFMSSVSMRQKRRLTGNVPSRRRDDWHGTACMRRRRGRGRKRFGRFISPLPTMRMITRKRFFLTCSAEAV